MNDEEFLGELSDRIQKRIAELEVEKIEITSRYDEVMKTSQRLLEERRAVVERIRRHQAILGSIQSETSRSGL